MRNSGQHPVWQRLLALLSVLAVAVGLAPPEPTRGDARWTPSLTPTPMPELRAAVPAPPATPQILGAADLPVPRPPLPRPTARRVPLRAVPGHPVPARTQRPLRQLDGG